MKRIVNNDKLIIDEHINRAPFSGYLQVKDAETGNLLVDGHNLITYSGRQWLMHKVMNLNHPNQPAPGGIDPLNGFIFYFGIGAGGASIADPLTPIAPQDTDSALATPIAIKVDEQNVQENGQYTFAGSGKYKKVSNVDFGDDSVSQITTDSQLSVTLRTTVEDYEATHMPGGVEGTNCNEAGIFVSDPTNPLSFILFSRITFSTIRKDTTDNKRGFIIDWYFLF